MYIGGNPSGNTKLSMYFLALSFKMPYKSVVQMFLTWWVLAIDDKSLTSVLEEHQRWTVSDGLIERKYGRVAATCTKPQSCYILRINATKSTDDSTTCQICKEQHRHTFSQSKKLQSAVVPLSSVKTCSLEIRWEMMFIEPVHPGMTEGK